MTGEHKRGRKIPVTSERTSDGKKDLPTAPQDVQATLVELVDLSLLGKQLHWKSSGHCFARFTCRSMS